jgi:Sigma-70, region 4
MKTQERIKLLLSVSPDATQSEIAEVLGVSRQRVSQLAAKTGIKPRQRVHALRYSNEYRAWEAMIDRCYNERSCNFKHYGARGIVVCQRWRNSFDAFFADMGQRPSGGHSIDRINNDGNYEPKNCRWATKSEQRRNQRDLHEAKRTPVATARKIWLRSDMSVSEKLAHTDMAGWAQQTAYRKLKGTKRKGTGRPRKGMV